MAPIDGLSFQLYSARTFEPLEAQFELLAGLGYKKVEPFGGLFNDPQKLKSQLERHGMSAPSAHVGLDRLRADPVAALRLCRDLGIRTIYAPAPPPGERDGGEAEWSALGRELDRISGNLGLTIVAFDAGHVAAAREGFRRFGKGRHRAGLNFGDCCAYALAKTLDVPLLFKGNDFALTDIKPAL